MSTGQGNIKFTNNSTGGGSSTPIIITPAQITADQNNYNPAGFATATIVRVSGDNGIRAITSLTAQSAGNEKKIINVGAFPLYFPGESPNGAAANRLSITKDVFLFPAQSIDITYDAVLSRWTIADQEIKSDLINGVYINDNYGTGSNGTYPLLLINNFIVAQTLYQPATSTMPGSLGLGAGPTINSGAHLVYMKQSIATAVPFAAFSAAHIFYQTNFYIPTLSTAADPFTGEFQVTTNLSSATINNINSIGLRYSHTINGGKWQGFSRDNAGAETVVDTGITVTENVLYNFFFSINKAKTEVRFYINNVLVGVITGNMPNAVPIGARAIIISPGGVILTQRLNIINVKIGAIYS